MRLIKNCGEWLEVRVRLGAGLRDAALHKVPASSASWWYVFGSAALTIFMLQVVTGILLAIVYVPSADQAWNSLQVLNHDLTLGWFLRGMHGWGSNFMVALVLIHMFQVFIFGAHKYPRELTWVVGVFLLLMTLGMAFTGQVLRFDQDAYWGIGIGASISGRVPAIGRWVVNLLLGGPIIGGETLSRFFTLHVFVIPGLLFAFVGLHVLLVFRLGVNEWPMPSRLVNRQTYLKEYEQQTHTSGVAFVPHAIWMDLVFSAAMILAVAACSALFGPFGPTGPPDPTIIQTAPRPDYFFLWIYSLLSLLPPELETPFLLVAPAIGIVILLLVPFVSGIGEKSWRRRPVAVLTVSLMAVALATFTRLAGQAPWSPVMNAWSGSPVPTKFLRGRSPLERAGAVVFQAKQCRNCHTLGNEGGLRGPALDDVALRLTRDQLVRQVLQGRGNMPAYGKNLKPAEVEALVSFLTTLHPADQSPARDASASALSTSETHDSK